MVVVVGGRLGVGTRGRRRRLLTLSPLLSAPCSGAPPGRVSPADRGGASTFLSLTAALALYDRLPAVSSLGLVPRRAAPLFYRNVVCRVGVVVQRQRDSLIAVIIEKKLTLSLCPHKAACVCCCGSIDLKQPQDGNCTSKVINLTRTFLCLTELEDELMKSKIRNGDLKTKKRKEFSLVVSDMEFFYRHPT